MNYLMDTSILIWLAKNNLEKIEQFVPIVENPENTIFISMVSFWEIRIKESMKKLTIDPGLYEAAEDGDFHLLPILINHVDEILSLPHHHRDPFDRLLIAQAKVEKLTLLTTDINIAKYSEIKTIGAL